MKNSFFTCLSEKEGSFDKEFPKSEVLTHINRETCAANRSLARPPVLLWVKINKWNKMSEWEVWNWYLQGSWCDERLNYSNCKVKINDV